MKHKRRRKLINQGGKNKTTRLHKLAMRGNVAQMEEHLAEIRRTMMAPPTTTTTSTTTVAASAVADFHQYINARSRFGATALDLACHEGFTTERSSLDTARLLIREGADIHVKYYPRDGIHGMSILDSACWDGSKLVLQMLFDEFGLDPNYTRASCDNYQKSQNGRSTNDSMPPLSQLLFGAISKLKEKKMVPGGKDHYRYLECIKIVTGNPLFDVAFHENLDVSWNPMFICLGLQDWAEKDAMYDFLVVLLQRGFNPNGKLFNCTYLQKTVEYKNEECAKALVLAGADVYNTAWFATIRYTKNNLDGGSAGGVPSPADDNGTTSGNEELGKTHTTSEATWTNSLEVCDCNISKRASGDLLLCYNAIRAVSGIKLRRGLLGQSPERLISRTWAAVNELKEFGRYAEATEALASIVLMVPQTAFSNKERFSTLNHLVRARALNFHFRSAQKITNMLIGEFRKDPIPRLQYSCLLFHPMNMYNSPLTEKTIKWVRIVADVAEYQLNQPDFSFQFTEESSFTEEDVRAYVKCIQSSLEIHSQVCSGVVDVEQQFYKLFMEFNYEKALEVIGKTLDDKEMMGRHHNVTYLRMLQAVAHYERARDILYFSRYKSDDAALNLGTEKSEGNVGWVVVKDHLKLAIKGLDNYTEEEGDAYPVYWIRLLSLVILGIEDDKLENIAIETMKKIREERCQIPKAPCLGRSMFRHPGLKRIGDFQHDIKYAFNERSIAIQLSLLDNLHAMVKEGSPSNTVKGFSASLTSNLEGILEDMSSLPLIRADEREVIQHHVDEGALRESAVVDAWLEAASAIKQSEELAFSIRSALAQLTLEQEALPAHQQGKSARVVGILLKEALEWDGNVFVPQELQEVQEKMAPPRRCDQCCIAGVHHCCPCGKAYYCSKECQVKAWKTHKKTCPTRKRRKSVPIEIID